MVLIKTHKTHIKFIHRSYEAERDRGFVENESNVAEKTIRTKTSPCFYSKI